MHSPGSCAYLGYGTNIGAPRDLWVDSRPDEHRTMLEIRRCSVLGRRDQHRPSVRPDPTSAVFVASHPTQTNPGPGDQGILAS